MIVPDGMPDDPIESLGNKTPLQVANTENMDYLAKNGCTGLVQIIPENMKPGSDIGNLGLLGYDPKKYFSGRAPLEATYLDIHLSDDEIAFRCNLVTIKNDQMVDYSAGHISTRDATLLIKTLNEQLATPEVKFYPGKSYRHLMVIKTAAIQELLDAKCTPPHDISGQNINFYLPQTAKAEVLLNLMSKSKAILLNHPVNQSRLDFKENPANMIWLWGQGRKANLPLFKEKFGLEGAIISAVDLINGIGKLIGLEIIKVPNITGYYDTNYLGKAQYALKALEEKDFVFIHVEAPDEAGHNGDIKMKIACIERIDKEIVGTILDNIKKDDKVRILICPDHPTPVEKRTHTGSPVGFIMFGEGISPDGSTVYNESSTQQKGLKFSNGTEMMEYFIKGRKS